MKAYNVTGGLGKWGHLHPRTITVTADNPYNAAEKSIILLREDIQREIGKNAPVLGKFINVTEVEEM